MKHDQLNPDRVALRPAETVMRLARMGSFHQSRLSFMRVLLRRLKAENWRFERRAFEIDARGPRGLYHARPVTQLQPCRLCS